MNKNIYLNGEYRSYHYNKQPRRHAFYDNNIPHGEYYRWDEDGEIMEHCIFIQGRKLDIDPAILDDDDKLYLTIQYNLRFINHGERK